MIKNDNKFQIFNGILDTLWQNTYLFMTSRSHLKNQRGNIRYLIFVKFELKEETDSLQKVKSYCNKEKKKDDH